MRALLIVGALLSGASGSAGFVGGRMSVPAPPAEVRYVPIPAPVALVMPAEAVPVVPAPAVEPAPAVIAPPVEEAASLPAPRPKAEPKPEKPAAKRRQHASRSSLPSCAFIRREYEAMTMAQRWAAYRRATPEQIAHGKRCLGM